jgi:SHS2 domain-containing protein
MYEAFDHTADLGLRVRARDLETLFAEAAAAVFTAIIPDLTSVQPQLCREVRLPLDDREYLLFDWLKSLLFLFDSEHLLFGRFQVRFDDAGLTGSAWGEPLDRNRHVLEHEVKAITYHGLRLEQNEDCWLAEVIVDI